MGDLGSRVNNPPSTQKKKKKYVEKRMAPWEDVIEGI